jgi:GNAT superfamily N-acetyltransferase
VNAYVRKASPEDAEQIAIVHVRSWQAAYRERVPQDYLDGLNAADRVGRWRDALHGLEERGQGIIVAVADDTVCGFAVFGPTRDQDEDPQRTGEVNAIYLLAEAWGRGLGRLLMAEAVRQLAARYEQATLWVLDSNDRARQFYARNGWAEDGSVKHDDSRGFPLSEVRYRRPLP